MFAKVLRYRIWCFYGLPLDGKAKWSVNSPTTRIQQVRQCQTIPCNVFSLFNCKKVVKSSKYGFTEGPTSIETTCPCSSPDSGNKVFINKTSGTFICSKCHFTGKFSAIEELFREPKSKDQQVELAQKREKFLRRKQNVPIPLPTVTSVKEFGDQEQQELLSFLDLPLETLKDLEIFTREGNLYLPLKDVLDDIVGYKIIAPNTHKETSLPEKNSFGCLIKRNQKKESSTAIVVLTVMDFLALSSQKNLGQTIVCLPHGFHSLPQECLPVLEKYQKLILWFDYNSSSAASWDVAKNFAKKLDEKRCFLIRPTTDSQSSAHDASKQQMDLKAIISKSLPLLHKSITTFGSLREDVLSDLQNIDKVQGVKWKRYPTLNKLLKGHRKGELTILTGSTGCGKTTFMSEYSLDLALQGVTTLWGSFEIRNTRLATTLLRQMAGHPFDPVTNLADFNYWADEFEKLPLYFMTFHGQQSIKVVMEAIEHATYVNDIQHVIIDNVQFMMGISEEVKHGDRFWKQDAIIAAFRTFATKKNCHVTLVIHPRKERDTEDLSTSSIFGSAKASQEADNVLIIQDKRLQSIRGKKFLQVAKNRYSGDLGIMPLDFDKEALSYAQKARVQRSHSPKGPAGEDGGDGDGQLVMQNV